MPAILSGIHRKVALLTISLTGVGWLLVVIGFAIAINKSELIIRPKPPNLEPVDQHDPNSYLYWVVCFTGPFMILASVAHAVLWQPVSSILGAVSSLLMVLLLTGLGMILYWNGLTIREDTVTVIIPYIPTSFKLQFSGAIICTFFLTLTMTLWHFYDFEQLASTITGTAILRGIARKVALPFIALTGIGWLLVVIGFAIAIDDGDLFRQDANSYPYWVVSVGGPFTIIAVLVHTIPSKYPTSAAVGGATSVLSVFFLTGLGMIMYTLAVSRRLADGAIPNSLKLMFAGAIITTVCFTPVLMLWHFYDFEAKRNPAIHYSNIDLDAKQQPQPQPQKYAYGHTDI